MAQAKPTLIPLEADRNGPIYVPDKRRVEPAVDNPDVRKGRGGRLSMSVDDEVREQLLDAMKVIQPYARSQGKFHDPTDLRAAIKLALQFLQRADLLADYRLPPTR
jgi:hypothetical protein